MDTVPGVPRDPGVSALAGGQIGVYVVNSAAIVFLNSVGTFDAANPLEIRGAGGKIGQTAAGAFGFNAPSLLGVANNAPYFHDGSAASLDDVFAAHTLTDGVTAPITSFLNGAQRGSLKTFLNAIDGRTPPLRSAADDFRDLLAGGP